MTLDEIIAALEAATEPSRELDAAIHLLDNSGEHGLDRKPWRYLGHGVWNDDSEPKGCNKVYAPRFTSSLDAAVSLVPKRENLSWSIESGSPGIEDGTFAHIWSEAGPDDLPSVRVTGATTAIALCLAALKARQVTP